MNRLLLLALAACSAAPWMPPAATDLDHAAPPVPAAEITMATLTEPLRAMAAPLVQPFAEPPTVPVRGAITYLHGPSVCAYSYDELPRPIVTVDRDQREPRVGQRVRIGFMKAALAAPTDWPGVILYEIRDPSMPSWIPPYDLTPLGFPGCWLHVDLAKCKVLALPQEGVQVLDFELTPDLAGKTIVMQQVVVVPLDVASSGLIVGHGVAVTVGAQ